MGAQLRLKLDRTPTFRREDFVVSENTADALRILDAWPSWRGGALALIGPSGSGKTHLATAWAQQTGAVAIDPARPVSPEELSRLEGSAVLVDDADKAGADPAWSETLFHLINMAARPGGGLLITAQTAPSGWTVALPDLRSRLNAMPMAELGPPDDVVLQAVLERFFFDRNIRPAEDLLPYLVNRIERSVAAARDIVIRLDETADAKQRAITKALARQILDDEAEGPDQPPS